MKRLIYLFTIIIFCQTYLFSQSQQRKYCGTTEITNEALTNPEKRQILDQLEIFTKQFIDDLNSGRVADTTYIIPLVIHIIHDYDYENISYEQIDHGVLRINEDFNGLNDDLVEVIDTFTNIIGFPNIEFRLATKDPDGNCTYGVTRTASPWTAGGSVTNIQSLVNWDDKKYVNIYVVRSFEADRDAAAFANKPGMGSSEYGDYIFCLYNYFGDWNFQNNTPSGYNWQRHTMPHEMGHFFNLDHPWGPTNGPNEEGNCSLDDGVEDTPPTMGTDANAFQSLGLSGCPLDQVTCEPPTLDNVQNIMDYSSCAHMFTKGQADRMLAAANSLAGNRWYLWQEDNLVATGTDDNHFFADAHVECAPIPDFKPALDIVCAGGNVTFENHTYNYRSEDISYLWSFPGGNPAESSDENPEVQYDTPGNYDVFLTACNGDLCRDTIMRSTVTILSQMDVSLESGVAQSFEDVAFPNTDSEIWSLGNDFGEQHWERTEIAANKGTSSFRIKSENYSYDRRAHAFSTPELNLSEYSQGDLLHVCFDIAYAKRLPYNGLDDLDGDGELDYDQPFSLHHDELLVYWKKCGELEWNERPRISTRPGIDDSAEGEPELYLNQQQQLATVDKIHFNSFIPNTGYLHEGGDWKQICVSLQSLAGEQKGMLKFEFVGTGKEKINDSYIVSDNNGGAQYMTASTIGGNWLYLDNILIGPKNVIQVDTTRLSVSNEVENLLISPNPLSISNGLGKISFNLFEDSEVTIKLTNFLGRNVGSIKLDLSTGPHEFLVHELFTIKQKGSYIISVEGSNYPISEILIIR